MRVRSTSCPEFFRIADLDVYMLIYILSHFPTLHVQSVLRLLEGRFRVKVLSKPWHMSGFRV